MNSYGESRNAKLNIITVVLGLISFIVLHIFAKSFVDFYGNKIKIYNFAKEGYISGTFTVAFIMAITIAIFLIATYIGFKNGSSFLSLIQIIISVVFIIWSILLALMPFLISIFLLVVAGFLLILAINSMN